MPLGAGYPATPSSFIEHVSLSLTTIDADKALYRFEEMNVMYINVLTR